MIATGCRASLCLLTRCGRRWHRCCFSVLATICDPSPPIQYIYSTFLPWMAVGYFEKWSSGCQEAKSESNCWRRSRRYHFLIFQSQTFQSTFPNVGWSYFKITNVKDEQQYWDNNLHHFVSLIYLRLFCVLVMIFWYSCWSRNLMWWMYLLKLSTEIDDLITSHVLHQ